MGERKYARVTPLASNAKTIKAQGRYDATRSNDLGERQSRESFSGEAEGGDQRRCEQSLQGAQLQVPAAGCGSATAESSPKRVRNGSGDVTANR